LNEVITSNTPLAAALIVAGVAISQFKPKLRQPA
jgi:uncharacterized membrane protein YidH (DUF202 family)